MNQAKFPFASKVIVKKAIAGIVLYSYNMYNEGAKPYFIYRIIVDANEIIHRVRNLQKLEQDVWLFKEDFDNLISTTEQVAVIETGEDTLELFD